MFGDHVRAIEAAIVAGARDALAPLLAPLLPAFLVAAGEAVRTAAAKAAAAAAPPSASGGPMPPRDADAEAPPEWPRVDARLLAPPLRELAALLEDGDVAASLEGDARWAKASDEQRWVVGRRSGRTREISSRWARGWRGEDALTFSMQPLPLPSR